LAGNEVVCLDSRTGAVEWRHELPEVETDKSLYHVALVGRPTVIIREKAILVARGGKEITAIDPRSGEKLWSAPCGSGFRFPPDLFVIGDDVWVGESVAWQKEPDLQRGRDILTGRVTARIDTSEAFIAAHHHRCYRNIAWMPARGDFAGAAAWPQRHATSWFETSWNRSGPSRVACWSRKRLSWV
jgi:hypothetical protein